MKYIKRLFSACLFSLLLLFTSCNKWLDVNPKTQIKEKVQFSSKQGYVDALFGVYQNAIKTTGYGRNLSFGLPDILAQRYENKLLRGTAYYNLTRYLYAEPDVQETISNLFSNLYGSIAQANYILKNMESSSGILDETTKSIIKGEALGMRGFIHFDLARLFSESYANGTNAAAPSIAYLKEFTVTPQLRLKLGEVLDLCEADLKAAEILLAVNQDIDQIAKNQGSTNEELFLQFRQNHLNYWAVKAALARLYLYKGDKVNALKYALEVINSKKFNFVIPGSINENPEVDESDLTFSSEHIFSFYMSGLKAIADDVFKISNAKGDLNDLYSDKDVLESMYQTTVPDYGTDIRSPRSSKSLWKEGPGKALYTKKYWSDAPNNVKQRLIPVIKLAELYYIAAESASTKEEGINYLNEVRINRLIPALSLTISQASFDNEIMLEYRKEFYAEGQLWFFYKRKGLTQIPGGLVNPMTKAQYVLPLPNTELEFGTSNN